MIRYYALDGHGLRGNDVTAAAVLPRETLWIDLLEPTVEEELKVERDLGIDVPTREEMREIETSNRLYEEGDALYMTATVVTKLDTDRPTSDQITFILTPDRLITNRYVDPLVRNESARAQKKGLLGVPEERLLFGGELMWNFICHANWRRDDLGLSSVEAAYAGRNEAADCNEVGHSAGAAPIPQPQKL